MTPADRRIAELIDRWLASIDLHLKYAELSDSAYFRAQPWPKHDRPSRWVLEVARQKILELKRQCEARQAAGDVKFAESLELMGFLANLVGIQNVQRFVPLADAARENSGSSISTAPEPPLVYSPAPRSKASSDERRKELPPIAESAAEPAPVTIVAPPPVPATASPASKPAAPAADSDASKAPAPISKPIPTDLKNKIMTDAVRLLKWGKPWHELAELIGRMADRPAVPEIRKMLRTHKNEIEAMAAEQS